MKKFNSFKTLLFLCVAAVSLTSCDDDDYDNVIPSTNTAYDLVSTSPDFSVLKAALDVTGLDATLKGPGTFTVFAPKNAAFIQFLQDNNLADLEAVPIPLLRETLLYHVLGTEVVSSSLSDGYVKTSANNATGQSLDVYVQTGAQAFLNDAALDMTALDIDVDNGVVHVLNDVINLPTVVDLADANPMFSNLVAALEQEDLDLVLDGNETTGSTPAPFTVFAPTNDAFQAYIDSDPNDGVNSISDILALSNLSNILTFHVVGGASVRAGSIVDDAPVDPIASGTFTIDTTPTIPEISINGVVVARIIATDVTATNGVIHAIDFVLLPQ